jgi:hypothetical protein
MDGSYGMAFGGLDLIGTLSVGKMGIEVHPYSWLECFYTEATHSSHWTSDQSRITF